MDAKDAVNDGGFKARSVFETKDLFDREQERWDVLARKFAARRAIRRSLRQPVR